MFSKNPLLTKTQWVFVGGPTQKNPGGFFWAGPSLPTLVILASQWGKCGPSLAVPFFFP